MWQLGKKIKNEELGKEMKDRKGKKEITASKTGYLSLKLHLPPSPLLQSDQKAGGNVSKFYICGFRIHNTGDFGESVTRPKFALRVRRRRAASGATSTPTWATSSRRTTTSTAKRSSR